MTDDNNTSPDVKFDALSDEAMASMLRKLADSPRSLSPEHRAQLLNDAALRIALRTAPVTVDLGDGFTFVQQPPTGELYDEHGLVSDALTLSAAQTVAAAVVRATR